MLSRLVFLVVEVTALVAFGALVFKVPLRGSLGELAVIALISAFTFSGLGLLIASRARTIEAANGLMNLVMLPMWIGSGVFFSVSNYPKAVQPFVHALPLTAVIDALRANMLQGEGLRMIAPNLGIAAAWMVISFAIALKIFRWR
jgi:ABC-type multidrug transport system permease subunit